MYEENHVTYHYGIDWKNILIKIILIILFILLLLWLFPKADLDVFYDSVYTNNIKTMKEAARDYYTVDKLPKNVGESTSMTLKQMVDNHMIIQFRDKDKNYCDENSSKVEVTKISDSEYALKVVLNCGDQKDYILDTIGCTTVCSNGTCQTIINNGGSNNSSIANNTNNNNTNNNSNNASNNDGNGGAAILDETDYSGYGDAKSGLYTETITYYQFRKAVTTTKTIYTCPEGYTKSGTKCTKTSTGATIDATPVYGLDKVITTDAKLSDGEEHTVYVKPTKKQVGTDYTCPSGYTLNGKYCIKYTDAIEHPGKPTYSCPTGWTLSGTKCTKTTDATYTPGGTSYTCDNGGTLSGTKCTITKDATPTTTYTCPSGYDRNGTSCYKVYNATANTTYSCPSGYDKSGTGANTKCTKSTSYNATPSTKYSCPNGGSLSGTTCTISTSYNATATTTYTYGSWVNGGTKYYTTAGAGYVHETDKLVFQGYISGATCGTPCGNKGTWYKYIYYTRSKTPHTTYSCPNGGTLSGAKCYKSSTYAATATTTYSCPNGGTLSGTKCYKTESAKPITNTTYTCPQGGTLNGTKCTITTSATPKTTYSCPSGYSLSGTKCTYTYNATPHTGTGSYSCPNGGTLSGTKCIHTQNATEKPGAPTYTCPEGFELLKDDPQHRCIKRIDATGTPIYEYSCPEGYTKNGTGENTTCSKVVKTEGEYYCEDAEARLTDDHKCVKTVKGEIESYTCPADYTLTGTKCVKKTVETIDATASTTTSTSYKYTWSKSSTLAGWEFTGKTKTETHTYTAGQK